MARQRETITTGVVAAYLIIAGTAGTIYLAVKSLERERKLPRWMR